MSSNSLASTLDKKELRNFGLVFAAGLILFFGLLIPWLIGYAWPVWPWIAAGVFAIFGIIFPIVLSPLNWLWLKIGFVLGWINTRIILGLIFFVILFPISLVMRIIGKDSMHRKLDEMATTYRVSSKSAPKNQIERPF